MSASAGPRAILRHLMGGGQMLSWPTLVFVVLLAGILATSAPLADPDTYWHLAAARWMLEHGAVPATDPFSSTAHGAPWLAHEWLSELILEAVFRLGSWTGLAILAATLAAMCAAVVARFLVDRLSPVRALILLAVTPMALHGHVLARPHLFGLVLLAWWTSHLATAAEAGRAPRWPVATAMALWANLHGSFIFGLGLLPVFAADAWLAATAQDRWALVQRWAGFAALALAASLVSPYGLHGLLFPFQVADMRQSLALINEWKSPNFQVLQATEVWIMLLLAGLGLLRMPVSWPRLLLLMGLVHLALKHIRHADLLAVVAPLVVALPLARALARFDAVRRASRLDAVFAALRQPAGALPTLLLAAATTALVLAQVPVQRRLEPPGPAVLDSALAAVQAAAVEGPVFNHYNFGGYLIYRGVPVFIDGRADLYGDDFVKRCFDAWASGKGLLPLLDEHQVGWTLLPESTMAVRILDDTPGWLRLYSDASVVVHRRVPSNPVGVGHVDEDPPQALPPLLTDP